MDFTLEGLQPGEHRVISPGETAKLRSMLR
jgi:hypothetical protein